MSVFNFIYLEIQYKKIQETASHIMSLNCLFPFLRMNFLSNILREEGGFEYKKAIVDSIVTIIRDIPDAKESGLLHLCEFIEDCEFTYLSTQVSMFFCYFLVNILYP